MGEQRIRFPAQTRSLACLSQMPHSLMYWRTFVSPQVLRSWVPERLDHKIPLRCGLYQNGPHFTSLQATTSIRTARMGTQFTLECLSVAQVSLMVRRLWPVATTPLHS